MSKKKRKNGNLTPGIRISRGKLLYPPRICFDQTGVAWTRIGVAWTRTGVGVGDGA